MFSEREIEIIRLVRCQLKTAEIADRMHLSVKSIEKYLAKMREKTDCNKTVGVVDFMIRNGILPAIDPEA